MSKDIRIKNHLFRLRRIRGYSQKRLAYLLGQRSTRPMSDYERGRKLPPVVVAMTMEIVLGTKLSEIYGDLYQDLSLQAVAREDRLPGSFTRQIRGRVFGKD